MSSSEPLAPRADPAPFDLPGAGRAAALCLHGLTGTPYEVRPLGEALAARGVRALGPALPGHNETPERLTELSYEDWLECARTHLHALRAQHQAVFCVGLSMGGLLALALAAEEPLDALAVIGTPLYLRRRGAWLAPVLKHVYPFARKLAGSDIRDPEARRRHPSYTVMPLHGVQEVMRLQVRVRASLAQVTAPILIAHGAHDRTASPDDSRELRASVGSSERQLLIFESSGHVVPVDRDGPALATAVCEFLASRV